MRLQMKHKGEPMYVDVPDMDNLKVEKGEKNNGTNNKKNDSL